MGSHRAISEGASNAVTPPGVRSGSRAVFAVLAGNALLYFANRASLALIGLYVFHVVQQQGGDVAASTALVATLAVVSSAVELVGAIPLGALTDRFPVRTLMVLGTLLGAFATQLFGLTGLAALFFVSRALEGVSSAATSPATLAYLADATNRSPKFRGRIMSFYELTLLAGLALGFLAGGAMWTGMGAGAFGWVAVIYLVAAALFYWGAGTQQRPNQEAMQEAIIQPSAPAQSSVLISLRLALADGSLRRLAPAWLAINAVVGLWLTLAGPILASPQPVPGQYLVGLFTPTQVGTIMLGYVAVFAVGVTAWGFALAFVPRVRALRITLLAMLVVCFLLYLLNGSGEWPDSWRWGLVAIAALIVMVESGFTPAALSYLADVVGGSKGRGAAMGIYMLLLGLGNFLGVAIGGIFSAQAFNGLVLGTLILAVAGLVAVTALPEVGPISNMPREPERESLAAGIADG